MTKTMLIDAAHAEETRVVVVDGNRIEELDFESSSRKQLRGNIYLAKVTRVEPSLQAAFIEYGGNRHGFLAFNEIHPDYYQIPVADREALLREEAEEEDEPPPRRRGRSRAASSDDSEAVTEDEDSVGRDDDDDDDVMEEEVERRRRRLMRRYKIQEVIKRRQIMLVQVVKEERGNKGAALTTYLSLAGRYCVLMPNTARGGGISRKITVAADRKRLKTAIQSLEVPQGMGLIVRTAGAARTKAEIKRDYEYLLRLWESIREQTLKSIAPALIYEEEDLVKRALRDMFDKDIDSIQVEGEAGYREARDFMRMIMPSQAKKILQHKEPTPLFVRHRVEDQLSQLHSPTVPLKSGGYLVINQTEALVAIDVNSGKATRERNIEATALKTNMEAAAEAARQMRLRDLAGLIVIDFIDMDESKNNRAVEKQMKDCLKDDRARIQMGKISGFGLMEISRQRRRAGLLEGATHICEHCQGMGRVRSVENSALAALRAVEMESVRAGAGSINLYLPAAVALYVLNEKRAYLARLETVQDLYVTIVIEPALSAAEHRIERVAREETRERVMEPARLLQAPAPEAEDDFVYAEEEDDEEQEGGAEARTEMVEREDRRDDRGEADGEGRNGKRRRRRRRGGRRDETEPRTDPARSDGEEGDDVAADGEDDEEDGRDTPRPGETAAEGEARRRRRRRGRRGGRRTQEDERRDVYAWRAAGEDRQTVGEEVYDWRDGSGRRPPAAAGEGPSADRAPSDRSGRGPRPPREDRPAADPLRVISPSETSELPSLTQTSEEGRGRRRRPRRGRNGGAGAEVAQVEDTADAVAEAEVAVVDAPIELVADDVTPVAAEPAAEAVAEPAAKPKRVRASRAKKPKAEAEAEAAPESVAEAVQDAPAAEPAPVAAAPQPVTPEPAAPEPVAAAPVTPDPAEIVQPAAQPKRGWWRKG